jgi:hypothetical protein
MKIVPHAGCYKIKNPYTKGIFKKFKINVDVKPSFALTFFLKKKYGNPAQ